MEYILSAAMAINTVTVTLLAKPLTKITAMKGIVLLYNTITISTVASAKGWNMTTALNSFSFGSIYNISVSYPTWGPNFNSKCILGFFHMKYKGSWKHDFYFTNSMFNNYQAYHLDSDSSPVANGKFFCFGNDSECAEAQSYMDPFDLQCYTASTCPLPVYNSWTSTTLCPMCVQLICLNCTSGNRSNCLSCGLNSYLSSGLCICNSGYWLKNTTISSSGSGQWNNQFNSLTVCM
jgi:hypothetical protein